MAQERLDKLLAGTGRWSRSEAKALIRAGRVCVDGRPSVSGEQKLGENAVISVDGAVLRIRKQHWIMLHKPAGVLSATEDRREQTVLDLLPRELQRQKLFPVGRLDKDTTGLLLLTDDGETAHRITAPKNHVPKRYLARVDGVLDADDVAAFSEGLVLADGTKCLSAVLELCGPELGRVTVYEGKYHQVKRMFAARGKPVLALHRESIGALELDPDLAPGEFRELRPEELTLLTRTEEI